MLKFNFIIIGLKSQLLINLVINHHKVINNFFVGLIEYYNKSDIGTLREDLLFDFLESHIPTRCNVIKGGFVFDSTGSKSSQIDLMVCNDQTFQFKKSGDNNNKTKSFNCVEGCYAVISVKSYLNKAALIDSLQNLASVSTINQS